MLLFHIKAIEKVGLDTEKNCRRDLVASWPVIIWQIEYYPLFKSKNMGKNNLIYD